MTEQEWLTSTDPQAMLRYVRKRETSEILARRFYGCAPYEISERKLRLFACACCRQVWHLLTDERSRNAVEVAEQYADGVVTCEALDDAWAAAWAAIRDTALAAASDAAWAAQAELVREIAGNPFRPPVKFERCVKDESKSLGGNKIVPGYPDPTVLALAQVAYEERRDDGTLDPDRLAILADALEDACCTDEVIQDHLRSPGPHVRGCWVLDLLLGKE